VARANCENEGDDEGAEAHNWRHANVIRRRTVACKQFVSSGAQTGADIVFPKTRVAIVWCPARCSETAQVSNR
jgi:hypothetical protein